MKFIKSRIDYKTNTLIVYFKKNDNKIVKRTTNINRLPPLTHPRPNKDYPKNSVADTKEFYTDLYKKKFIYNTNFDLL